MVDGMPGASRISDEDREYYSMLLRHHFMEGRIDAAELERRLGVVFAADDLGELIAVVSDLPQPLAVDLVPRGESRRRRRRRLAGGS